MTPLATNCWPKAPRGGGGGAGVVGVPGPAGSPPPPPCTTCINAAEPRHTLFVLSNKAPLDATSGWVSGQDREGAGHDLLEHQVDGLPRRHCDLHLHDDVPEDGQGLGVDGMGLQPDGVPEAGGLRPERNVQVHLRGPDGQQLHVHPGVVGALWGMAGEGGVRGAMHGTYVGTNNVRPQSGLLASGVRVHFEGSIASSNRSGVFHKGWPVEGGRGDLI